MTRALFVLLTLLPTLSSCAGNGEPPPPPSCDRDGDGYRATGPECDGNDCNDGSALVNPGAVDVCGNGFDENCSGEADEGCPGTGCDGGSCPGDDAGGGEDGGTGEDGSTGADAGSGGDAGAPVDLCAQPGVVFCEDFESGNLSRWNDMDGNTEITVPTDPGPHNVGGNHVARLYVPHGQRGTADLNHYYEDEGLGWDKLYLRWYIKWETAADSGAEDYDFAAENHGSGLIARDSSQPYRGSGFKATGYDKFTGSLEPATDIWGGPDSAKRGRMMIYSYYARQYMNCVDPEGSCWGDEFPCMGSGCDNADHAPPPWPPKMEIGRWYCLQLMLDGGTTGATGAENFWVDGVAYGPWENLHMRDTTALKINQIHITLFHHEVETAHANAGFRVDDVIASTRPIPCGPIR